MASFTLIKKAKLPRKRKKAAIKVQGRQWYHATIKLYKATQKAGIFNEPICKFWVNKSVTETPVSAKDGTPLMVSKPVKYW